MTQPLRQLAGKLGNPLGRGSTVITDAELAEFVARAEHLAEITEERTVRLARTVLHAAEDGQSLTYAESFTYGNVLDATAGEVAEFRAIVSAIKTAIPRH